MDNSPYPIFTVGYSNTNGYMIMTEDPAVALLWVEFYQDFGLDDVYLHKDTETTLYMYDDVDEFIEEFHLC